MSKLSRRAFLQTTAAATLATQLRSSFAEPEQSAAWPENGTLIPDVGWRLWLDPKAEWKDDTIYLPEDVNLAELPVNSPTGGWIMLGPQAGREVVLPTTVEQHYWGHSPEPQNQRPYTPEEYRYAAEDTVPQNGAYFGVSWWYRQIDIPAKMQGTRIFLHIRGARLRAEVYLNQKLVGYSIMEELPFECDLTAAATPGGDNQLAIRITNPFGRFDRVDGLNAQWGAVKLYRSHGFGGLDRGITVSAHPPAIRIADAYVLNNPDSKRITAFLSLETWDNSSGQVRLDVYDPANSHILSSETAVFTSSGAMSPTVAHVSQHLRCPDAQVWDLDHPKLYVLRATLTTQGGQTDIRTISFGFRWFAPVGLGTNAIFRLNGRRIKIYTALSWGYWGLNGLFPIPELAEKEVTQAKRLNLNCLNFHRNLAKEDVLRAQDRLGLLRYMEPGGGKIATGKFRSGIVANANSVVVEKPSSEADKFAQRYMFIKCVEMVKANRSHPSVIEYCLQNEIGADLKNPDTIAILEAMRAEDPSRCIVLNDGSIAPPRRSAQAWFEPYNPKIHRSDEEDWGGWWNQHQGAGGQWYDRFYKSPTEFIYKSPVRAQISEFGEMEGCATPDNHSLMIHQITDTYKKYGGDSYDLVDHQEILAATDGFLDQWSFRKAFPATEQLWLSLGKKCYDTWQNYLENARISDELDFAAISGWESTAIENHSGIVDNLRNFKSDPTPIAATLQPVRPIAKQHAICTALGEAAIFDLYLVNDTPQPVDGTLIFTAVTPSGSVLDLGRFPVPKQTSDQFSYLVQEALTTPALKEEGMYRFKFSLSSAPLATQVKDIWVADTMHPQRRPLRVAVSGITPALKTQLEALPDITVEAFAPGKHFDAIVSSGMITHSSAPQRSGDTIEREAQPVGSSKNSAAQTMEKPGRLAAGILEAVRRGIPLLAIPQTDALSEGVAKELAAAGAFTYHGTVGDFRAPWMGNWYFVRQHPVYDGLPVNQVMGIYYQAQGRQSNGLLIDNPPKGPSIEIVAAYSRDHDRNIGAGTFTCMLGTAKILYHRVPELHSVVQQRLLANALAWLTA